MAGITSVVTGAAGFIGSNLVEHLLSIGDNVVAVDSFLTGKRQNIKSFESQIRFYEGDVRDTTLMTEACRGADRVFHLAALASVPWSVEDPVLSHDHNVNGTLSMLIAARDAKIRRLVFASSAAIYGDTQELPTKESVTPAPSSPYALHKLIGEQYISIFKENYGLEAISCRFFNVFGPRQDPKSMYAAAIPNLLSKILSGRRPTIFGDGEQTRDFVHVSDVIQGLIAASNAPFEAVGQVFNLGCQVGVSINELTQKILQLVGSDLLPVHKAQRAGDLKHSLADITKAKTMLGFKPGYTAITGLEAAIDWFGENL